MCLEIIALLNKQLNQELFNEISYIQISSWCSQNGLEQAAKFFLKQAKEEHLHMQKIYNYLDESCSIEITTITQPRNTFQDIDEVIQYSLKNEQFNSQKFAELYTTANDKKDYNTMTFLNYFIEEQREEEVLFQKIIDRIKLIGTNTPGKLYFIDQIFGEFEKK